MIVSVWVATTVLNVNSALLVIMQVHSTKRLVNRATLTSTKTRREIGIAKAAYFLEQNSILANSVQPGAPNVRLAIILNTSISAHIHKKYVPHARVVIMPTKLVQHGVSIAMLANIHCRGLTNVHNVPQTL